MAGKEKRGLGRGLSALMADVDLNDDSTPKSSGADRPSDQMVPVEMVAPNPDQPRRDFPEADLQDLASSIREKGIIQPLIVRTYPSGNAKYQIVAGERRWRAAQIAQLHEIPIIVREFSDQEVLEIAIIENIQRADLNPVEEAMGYRQLQEKFGHTQEQLASALGKSRSYIANLLRLLALPGEVLTWLRDGILSIGHARALITTDNPTEIAKTIISGGLSVRETEALVKKGAVTKSDGTTPKPVKPTKDADTRVLEQDLAANLGMKVAIEHREGSESGKLVVDYKDFAELDELCKRLTS